MTEEVQIAEEANRVPFMNTTIDPALAIGIYQQLATFLDGKPTAECVAASMDLLSNLIGNSFSDPNDRMIIIETIRQSFLMVLVPQQDDAITEGEIVEG